MNITKLRVLAAVTFLTAANYVVIPQTARSKPSAKTIIFGVLHDGPMLEPIALFDKGRLIPPEGTVSVAALTEFKSTYYKPRTRYDLIFGGAKAGNAVVTKLPRRSECSPNLAPVAVTTAKARLGGKVMALATNVAVGKPGTGVRRLPTAAERAAVEAIAREEFKFLKVDARVLRSHNLTALDLNGDRSPEFVGSFYVADTPESRALLFLVVSKRGSNYEVEFSNVGITHSHQVMSGDIKDLDSGILNELLLDILDVDGDGTAEIFTYIQAFEGSNFRVHSRKDGRWEIMYEYYNYHCAY